MSDTPKRTIRCMSAAFWIGLVTLPAAVTATAVAAWIVAAVWPTLQQWARAQRPARIADKVYVDVGRRWGGTGRSGISLRDRAVAAASLVQAPRLWAWGPLPGWYVVIARDFEDPNEETKAAQAAARKAFERLYLPFEDQAAGEDEA